MAPPTSIKDAVDPIPVEDGQGLASELGVRQGTGQEISTRPTTVGTKRRFEEFVGDRDIDVLADPRDDPVGEIQPEEHRGRSDEK